MCEDCPYLLRHIEGVGRDGSQDLSHCKEEGSGTPVNLEKGSTKDYIYIYIYFFTAMTFVLTLYKIIT